MSENDRQVVIFDEKERMISLPDGNLPMPESGIYEGNLRYYAASREWFPIIEGIVSWLASPAAWRGVEDESVHQIQQILIFLEGVEMPTPPEFDCGDVEDCLSTSDIINNLNEQISNLNEQITDLQEQIEDIENVQESGGNDIPPPPPMADAGNDICRGSHFISIRLRDKLLEYWGLASTLTLQEFVESLLSLASIGFIPATSFWQFVFTVSDPDLEDDAITYTDRIQEAFFCAEWDLERAKEIINEDSSIPSSEKALWLSVLDLVQQGQIDEWGWIGTLDASLPDCSEGCPWVVVFDFNGSYEPDGSETLVIAGNTWTVTNGAFIDGVGYVALDDVMTIAHELPEQCRLISYYIQAAKGGIMLAADASFWWRGSSGTGSEQYSAGLRVLSADYGLYPFSVLGNPIMTQAKIAFDAFFHSGAFGQKIGWVKLVGTGAYPQS